MKSANPSPLNSSFLLYENINPNPSTVARAIATGWKKVSGDSANMLAAFCYTGRMNTPFRAAILACVKIISTPNIIELVLGAGIYMIKPLLDCGWLLVS